MSNSIESVVMFMGIKPFVASMKSASEAIALSIQFVHKWRF